MPTFCGWQQVSCTRSTLWEQKEDQCASLQPEHGANVSMRRFKQQQNLVGEFLLKVICSSPSAEGKHLQSVLRLRVKQIVYSTSSRNCNQRTLAVSFNLGMCSLCLPGLRCTELPFLISRDWFCLCLDMLLLSGISTVCQPVTLCILFVRWRVCGWFRILAGGPL